VHYIAGIKCSKISKTHLRLINNCCSPKFAPDLKTKLMTQYFITATGTDIGKTYITCSLIKSLIARNISVLGLKPIISGWEDYNDETDTCRILAAMGRPFFPDDIDTISPWRFAAPLSPDMAAAKEGREINFDTVVKFCNSAKALSEHLIIEGVGGVMVPINKEKTFLDLMQEVNLPAILVTGSYLGTISHTLTAINALKSRNIDIHKIIINESEGGVDLQDTKNTLLNFTDSEIDILERNGELISDTLIQSALPDFSNTCNDGIQKCSKKFAM